MMRNYHHLLFLAGALAWASANAETSLSIQEYLTQVQGKHEGLQGASMVSEATKERAEESTMSQSWQLDASAQKTDDLRRPLALTQFQTSVTQYSLGVSKLTDFGLKFRLSETVTPTSFVNVPAAFASFVPNPTFYDASTTFELTQSLWRNGFGRNTRAQQQVEEANTLASHHRNAHTVRQIRAQAENAYWNTAASQEIVRIQEENLNRANRLVEYSKGRASLDLADKADLLQANSVYRVRQLELAQSKSDLRSNSRQLNSMRGIDSDDLPEKLASVYIDNVDSLALPDRGKNREDVLAAMEESRAAQGNAQLGLEKNKPNLEAFVNFSLTGRDPDLNTAIQMMPKVNYILAIYGVRFTTSLDFGTASADRQAYTKELKAAELNLARKRFEQENEWNDLSKKFQEAKLKLQLARELETAQNEKYNHERDRLRRAKTTLFQVLQFEQDFATAQLTRIQREAEVRGLITQMKVFGGNS